MGIKTKQQKHVDGAGKVDGSVVVALPVDRWSAPESVNSFEGGGLTFWDGKSIDTVSGETKVLETHYDTRSGDVAFIDRYVPWNKNEKQYIFGPQFLVVLCTKRVIF